MSTVSKLQIIFQGNKKGLRIQRSNQGWRILLPNGGMYHAKDQDDLILYISRF